MHLNGVRSQCGGHTAYIRAKAAQCSPIACNERMFLSGIVVDIANIFGLPIRHVANGECIQAQQIRPLCRGLASLDTSQAFFKQRLLSICNTSRLRQATAVTHINQTSTPNTHPEPRPPPAEQDIFRHTNGRSCRYAA